MTKPPPNEILKDKHSAAEEVRREIVRSTVRVEPPRHPLFEMFEQFKLTEAEILKMGREDLAALMEGDVKKIAELSPARSAFAMHLAVTDSNATLEKIRGRIKNETGYALPHGFNMLSFFSANDIREPNDVRPGAFASIIAIPQVPFAPHTLIVDDAVADFFEICDIKIGLISQFTTTDAIPARMFNKINRFCGKLRMDTAQIAQYITLKVQNTSEEPARFTAVMYGFSADYVSRDYTHHER